MGYKDEPTLAKAFKAWRQEHKYTLKEAATITKIPLSTITRIEKGQDSPQIKNLALISKAFNMTMDELYEQYFSDIQKDQ